MSDEKDKKEKKSNEQSSIWYQFFSYQLKKISDRMNKSAHFHLINSGFYLNKMNNEFKALFEVLMVEQSKPRINQEFLCYRMKKRVEKVIQSKYEKFISSQVHKQQQMNPVGVFNFERGYTQFSSLILKSTYMCQKFWSELLETKVNVENLHQVGLQVSRNHIKINDLSKNLLSHYPNQLSLLMLFARYLNDIVNDEFNAFDYMNRAFQNINTLKIKRSTGDNEDSLFGENSFCSIFVLSTAYKNIGTIEFCNEEVVNLVGYTSKELLNKDINMIIPKDIAKVHRELMLQFFEKAESSVLNKIRELVVIDKDGYLIPVYLFSRLIPSLKNGLKMIGFLKRIQTLTFPPNLPSEFTKMTQDYIYCDSFNNVLYFSNGITLEFGFFPKMFLGNSKNSLFQKVISIEVLSHDFVDKYEDLKATGGLVAFETEKLIDAIEREMLSNEEYQYFITKITHVRLFVQLIELTFHNIVTIRIYRIVQVFKYKSASLNNTRQFNSNSINGGAENTFDKNAYYIGSQSMSSTQSSVYTFDKQIKDFKKKMMEKDENRQIKLMKKFMLSVLLVITLFSSLVFYFETKNYNEVHTKIETTIIEVLKQRTIVQLQMNLRSMINIANDLESDYFQLQNLTDFENRYDYLNSLCISQTENIKNLTSYQKLHSHDQINQELKGKELQVDQISENGEVYSQNLLEEQFIQFYIGKVVDLLNRTKTEQKSLIISQAIKSNKTGNISSQQKLYYNQVQISQYFIFNSGFKQLIPFNEEKMTDSLYKLQMQPSQEQLKINLLLIFSAAIIVIYNFTLVIIMYKVELNKSKVLSLYSELKLEDAKKSLTTCKKFYCMLTKLEYQEIKGDNIKNEEKKDELTKEKSLMHQQKAYREIDDDLDFEQQWERINRRIEDIQVNQDRLEIIRLRKRLATLEEEKQNQSPKLPQIMISHPESLQKVNNASLIQDTKSSKISIPGQSKIILNDLNYSQDQNSKSPNESQNIYNTTTTQSGIQSKLIKDTNFTRTTSIKLKKQKNKPKDKDKDKPKPKDKDKSESSLSDKNDNDHSLNSESNDLENHDIKKSKQQKKDPKKSKKQKKNKTEENDGVEGVNEVDPALERVGQFDDYQKMHSRTWKQIFLIVMIGLITISYFVYTFLFQIVVVRETKNISDDIKVGFQREIYINQLFTYLRERALTNNNTFYQPLESQKFEQFYSNEDQIINQQQSHPDLSSFMYSYFDQLDDKGDTLCSIASKNFPNQNITENCLNFKGGIFKRGYKQALSTFINYYTQISMQQNFSYNLMIAKPDVQDFFIAQETYLSWLIDYLRDQWSDQLGIYFTAKQKIVQLTFIIFAIYFFFINLIVTPRILKSLNETTQRSRGILNLIPNYIFKEMRQSQKILEIMKS